jgi:hypothetical protein
MHKSARASSIPADLFETVYLLLILLWLINSNAVIGLVNKAGFAEQAP